MKDRIKVLNRKAAAANEFGLDAGGIEWQNDGELFAWVDWQKGKYAIKVGAVDAYMIKIVRMHYTSKIEERSRIVWRGRLFQILPESFNPSPRDNTLQFLMQQLVDEPVPDIPPTPDTPGETTSDESETTTE